MIEIKPPKSSFKNIITEVPGSKSYTNRAFLIAALANGKSTIKGALESEDTKVMVKALRTLGIKIKKTKNKKGLAPGPSACGYEVYGKGGIFKKPSKQIHLENAGTAVRFLTAALATQKFKSRITGNKRMQQRPIKDLMKALRKLGVKTTDRNGYPPVTVQGEIKGGETSIKGNISSQYLSALLIAAPYAKEKVVIKVTGKLTSLPYADMTLDIMKKFGITVQNQNYKKFTIQPQKYKPITYKVEGDASSATYPLAIAALHGTKTTILNILHSSKQADILFLDILQKMGCRILNTGSSKKSAKSTKHIAIRGPKKLKPLGEVDLNKLPDAAMTAAILCAFARGTSKLTNIGNLRVKETDRISALAAELTKIGVTAKEGKTHLIIKGEPKLTATTGLKNFNQLHGNIIETYKDHRMAMCFAVAGTKIPSIKIKDPKCTKKTYPTFWKDLKKWGIHIRTTTNANKKKSNIVLSGLRGTGKSEIGKKLAKKLNYKFLDTDKYIEKKCKAEIPQIVKEKGWPYFRKQEAIAAKELSTLKKTVISTGGGMFTNPKNTKQFKKNGTIILLTAPPKILAKRTTKSTNRPTLTTQKSLLKEFRQLWEERKHNYYQAADAVLDVATQTNSKTADAKKKAKQIIALLS